MIERYTRLPLRRIWSEEHRYRRWLEVEILACEAWAELGHIPREAASQIRRAARIDPVRIAALEAEVRHDVIAFVTAVSESVGDAGRYVHYGLTSYDVVDTALSSLMVEALDEIIAGVLRLRDAVAARALEHRDTVMVGRTHGIHAEPITFGLKLALWYDELGRDLDRLCRARDVVAVGRVAGAVGTFAHIDPRVEAHVCAGLGLRPAALSTQVLQRDRHAEYMVALAHMGNSLDKFASEIRHLQRTEIREVEEPFARGQKGSSAMPHKKNPVLCEQLSGLARVLRGYAVTALENVNLWNERDISNSSVERIIIPDATTLLDYMVHRFTQISEGLRVFPERMLQNLKATGGLVHSQAVLLALIAKGMSREQAYQLVQGLALAAWEGGPTFQERVYTEASITRHLSGAELDQAFAPAAHLTRVPELFERVGLRGRG
ncbi:MAG: adenylosuccinate lyase [Bacillota bacterium]